MAKLQGLMFGLATLVLVVAGTIAFTRPWLPALKSDRGDIDQSMMITLAVTGFVFIATNLLLAFFAWRYQDAPGAKALFWHDNHRLELTWTLATAGIMACFLFSALNLWAKIQSPAPPGALLVEVTGQQFAWNVRYPGKDGVFGKTDHTQASQDNPIGLLASDPASADDIMLLNQLYLPLGRPVRVQVKSMDVVHSFFLPNFRVKQDAVPGMTTEIWFTPTALGDYDIACAQHCGLGHFRMRGQIHIVDPARFDKAMSGNPSDFETAVAPGQ
jgi:cytochrome c oxidase subunit 2